MRYVLAKPGPLGPAAVLVGSVVEIRLAHVVAVAGIGVEHKYQIKHYIFSWLTEFLSCPIIRGFLKLIITTSVKHTLGLSDLSILLQHNVMVISFSH